MAGTLVTFWRFANVYCVFNIIIMQLSVCARLAVPDL